jgi:YfiH family protein
LNIGRERGDSTDALAENYRRLGAAVGFDQARIALTKQIHGRTVRTVLEGTTLERQPQDGCDALTTNIPGIALIIYGADCIPVLLHDPVSGCVGAAHAGWRGTANGVVDALVRRMTTEYGAKPENMTAAIGPAIEAGCYETGAAEASALSEAVGSCENLFKPSKTGNYYADLKGLNALRLKRTGVKQIFICGYCTYCDERLFWSHRRDGTHRGLQGAVIML